MVFLTMVNMVKAIKVDRYWRKRQTLKMSAHYYGRARNCYSIAIRRVYRALMYVTKGRELRKEWARNLWERRMHAGCQDLGYLPEGSDVFLESLQRSDILLNRQSLSTLASWEPRTFKSLNKIAAVKARKEGLTENFGPMPKGIMTRGML